MTDSSLIPEQGVERPGRWDEPFDSGMTDEVVDRILSVAPFSEIDARKFPKNLPLREIIRNDTRLVRFRKGDLIVRVGDYGSSAFFIMKGSVRVVMDSEQNRLSDAILQRSAPHKKNWQEALSQLWKNSDVPEYRSSIRFVDDSGASGAAAGLRTEDGGTRVFLQDVPGIIRGHKTVQIQQGEFFGEIAALGRTPRTATIFSDEDGVELLEIKWQGLRDIRGHTPQIREHIDQLYRERSLLVHLRETPMFAKLTDDELAQVAAETRFQSFGTFDWHASYKSVRERTAANRLDDEPIIVEQGDYPNALILIRAGFARLSEIIGNGHRTVSYFGRGQYYGYREIHYNWKKGTSIPYQFTLRGIGHVDVLIVPSQVIERLVFPKLADHEPEIRVERRGETGEARLRARATEKSVSTDVLEFLVENRYINGTATMMINLDRCTRCDDCVRACANAHDSNPKFIRDGKQVGSLMIGHACMQCQDPICMIGCPTGAIHRETAEGNVIINDLTCIGCSSCAQSCPYENIQMVETRTRQGEVILDKQTSRPILKATKCDLCSEQLVGPACQRACPHDALVRVDASDRLELLAWFKR